MPKPFDATLKELIQAQPTEWLKQFGVPIAEPVEVISADLSTVTAAADILIRNGDRIVHIDMESGPDESLAERMLLYNVLAFRSTGLPVHTFALLLRSNAQRANLSDRVEYNGLSFRFTIVKVWELPAEELMKAGVGLLPLAVLGKPPAGSSRTQALPGQLERIVRRTQQEAPELLSKIITATFVLAGMHTQPDILKVIFQGAAMMIESSAYRVLEEWATARVMRELILKQGVEKFGPPTAEQEEKLDAIRNPPRLNRLAVRLLKVDSWDALLRGR